VVSGENSRTSKNNNPYWRQSQKVGGWTDVTRLRKSITYVKDTIVWNDNLSIFHRQSAMALSYGSFLHSVDTLRHLRSLLSRLKEILMKTLPRSSIRVSYFLVAFALWLDTKGDFVQAFSGSLNQNFRSPRQRVDHERQSFKKQHLNRHNSIFPRHRNHVTSLQSALAIPQSSFYLGLLAFQFGCQPLLTKAFTPKTIVRSTVVLAQDATRFLLCLCMLLFTGTFDAAMKQWTLRSALLGAGIPSALYLVQNYCSLVAYQNLPPVTYNILNQTKTLSAALCCYLVMGRRQSPLQIVSLLTLLLSAMVIEKIIPIRKGKGNALRDPEESKAADESPLHSTSPDLASGVIPILVASFISGLAGALTQKNLQILKSNTYVFSMELSAFSMIIMLTSLILGTPDGKRLRQENGTVGWTWKTWIPVLTNAAGGVLVGLVTKHSGAVKKGFALIFGLVLSGALQSYFSSDDDGVSLEQIAGGLLASISLWMHSAFPP
jgi:UDP-sugar transporter A1/2/3